MSALRSGWSSVFPSTGLMLLTDDGLATQVRNAIAAKQVEAVLLRDAAIPLTPAELTYVQSAIANVRMQRGQLIISAKNAMPANLRAYLNPGQVKQSLASMQDFDEGAVLLDRQASILTSVGLGTLRGRALRTGIINKIDHGLLDAAYVPPGPVGDAVNTQLNTGGPVSGMGYADKVGAALQRSQKHLSGEVAAAVAEMVTPTNLAIMAAVFVAVALANTNPVTGAAMDTILIGIAWWSAGMAGIRAIGHFIEATASALKAQNEAELDAAGQVYARALVGLGSALIQALMARFLTKRGGTAEEGAGRTAPTESSPPSAARTGAQAEAAGSTTRVGSYKDMTAELKGTGEQAHHLNQDAAFRDIIPRDEGLAVGMRGNAFKDVGSPHYEVHSSLESFWQPYRKGGDLFGSLPTNAQYGTAVEQALMQSGYSASEAARVAAEAAAQRTGYGLLPSAPVPRIPGRLPQVGR